MQGLGGKGEAVHLKMDKQYDRLGKYELQAAVKTTDLLVSDGKDPVLKC